MRGVEASGGQWRAVEGSGDQWRAGGQRGLGALLSLVSSHFAPTDNLDKGDECA